MWFNPQLNNLEWLFVLSENLEDTNGYQVFNFPGGLNAVAACKDEEEEINQMDLFVPIVHSPQAHP